MLAISCAFATSLDTPEHVALAESLGYHCAWLYDSPALYPDVWATLALSAQRTTKIRLGPAVLVPSLRHPMVNAAAVAMLDSLAPGRVEVAIGSGFTGRMTMGQRPLSWKFVRTYVQVLQALLSGEKTEWEGGIIQMLHPEGFGSRRPLSVPMLIGAAGPKGYEAADDLANGVFASRATPDAAGCGSDGRLAILTFGTVLDDEDPGSPRAIAAAGHAAAVNIHSSYEFGRDVTTIPGGREWAARLEAIPCGERHLATHDLHLIGVNERDAPMINGALLRRHGLARTAAEWRRQLAEMEAAGVTEIAYQPAGPDIPGELLRFAEVAGISSSA